MRNLSMLAVIIGLLGYIYVFEEVPESERIEREIVESQLINFSQVGKLKKISNKNLNLKSRGEEFFVGRESFPADKERINEFFKQLNAIKILRVLQDEEVKKIENELTRDEKVAISLKFENADIEFSLGKKINFNTNFYLKIHNLVNNEAKWVVAKYESSYSGRVNPQEAHRTDAAYLQLVNLFEIRDNIFISKNPFVKRKSFSSIVINSFRNKSFSINLNEEYTTPNIFKGLSYNDNFFKSYVKDLKNILALNVQRKNILKNKIATLKIDKDDFHFYNTHNGLRGYYLEFGNLVYEFLSTDFRKVFVPLQYFWNRTIPIEVPEIKVDNKSYSATGKGIWSKVFFGESHNIRMNYKKPFKKKIEVTSGKKTFLVNYNDEGVFVFDPVNDLIFHFLEKVE